VSNNLLRAGIGKAKNTKNRFLPMGPESDSSKPSQEVAKKIAKAAGVKSKSMFLPRHSALATLHFWQDLLLG